MKLVDNLPANPELKTIWFELLRFTLIFLHKNHYRKLKIVDLDPDLIKKHHNLSVKKEINNIGYIVSCKLASNNSIEHQHRYFIESSWIAW